MKALVMRAPGEYGVEDVKKPVPGFQEVLVRMHSVHTGCGVQNICDDITKR